MKFTPETLIEIYLNGSFTEEAQIEFDRLMRRNPAFAEKVTQAVAERLGPVPETTLENLTARLDPQMEALWALHKPSPFTRALKLTGQAVLGLACLGALYFASGSVYHKLQSVLNGPAAGLPVQSNLSQTDQQSSLNGTIETSNEPKGPDILRKKSPVSLKSAEIPNDGKVEGPASQSSIHLPSESKNSMAPSSGNSPPLSAGASANAQKQWAASLPLESSKSSGTTASEGNALRVAINTPKTQNVVVTVFDANGLLMRHLYQGILDAGEHYVDWDGKDELGNPVLPGDYTVVLDLGGKKMSGILKVLPNK